MKNTMNTTKKEVKVGLIGVGWLTAKPVPLRNLPAYSTVPASNTTS